MPPIALDHVQVAAPPGCESEARSYYGDLLGLAELAKPPGLAGRAGVWFALADGTQLHVGVDARFAPALKAHPALAVPAPELDALARALVDAGRTVAWDEALGWRRRFFTADPWGNRIEILARAPLLNVRDGEHALSFSFSEMARFNGGESPGGVAHAFAVMSLALPLLSPAAPAQRRSIWVRTPFGGAGARDGFELVLRAASGGRYLLDGALTRPERTPARERFVFGLRLERSEELWLGVREGVVSNEFVALAFAPSRTAEQEARLTELKAQMAQRIISAAPAEIYEILEFSGLSRC